MFSITWILSSVPVYVLSLTFSPSTARRFRQVPLLTFPRCSITRRLGYTLDQKMWLRHHRSWGLDR